MIQDLLLLLSGTQPSAGSTALTGQAALPVAGTPVLSTNVIDLQTARDMGEGQQLFGRFQIGATAYNNLTSLQFEVIAASDSALTTNIVTLGSTGPILLAALVANARFACAVNPLVASKGQRYVGLRYTTVGTTPTTGSVIGDIGVEIQDGQTFYATGIAVI